MKLSPASQEQLRQVQEVLADLRAYWPLTLRQIYYRLVAAGIIANHIREYSRLSRLLTQARLQGLVPWEAMEDRARSSLWSAGWKDSEHFVSEQAEGFLQGYRRDILQSQDRALEVWVEKDALSRICHGVAFGYCVPVIVARGFSSVSYLNECRKRVLANYESGKETRILYFGDLDPSGCAMLPAMLTTLQVKMGLGELVLGERCALTLEQVEEHRLPNNPDALKVDDTRARGYVEEFGEIAVELDALPPPVLEQIVRESIERNLDVNLLRDELEAQAEDAKRVSQMKKKVARFVAGQLSREGE